MKTLTTTLAALSLLTACSGGGTQTTASYTNPPYQPGTEAMAYLIGGTADPVSIVQIDTTSGAISTGSGQGAAGNRLQTGLMSGTVTPDLFGGGTIALDAGTTGYIEANTGRSFFLSTGNTISIVAAASTAPLPTGVVTLTGKSQIAVNNGASQTFLDDAFVTLNFAAGTANMSFEQSSNGSWLDVTGANISGDTITGGTATASTTLAPTGLSGSIQAHEGRIFSTDRTTVGGVLMIDETSSGGAFKAVGVYQAQ